MRTIDLDAIASAPGVIESHSGLIRDLAIAAWIGTILAAVILYASEKSRGYRLPAHKAALLLSTGGVSIAAWGFAPPFMAFAIVNLFHAIQYFAIVWLKEGGRIREKLRLAPARAGSAFPIFFALCALFGIAYFAANNFKIAARPVHRLLAAPFLV